MNKLIAFLLLLFPPLVYGQNINLDKLILECSYLESVVVDTTARRIVTDTLVLKIGESASAFYSKSLYFTDSLSQSKAGKAQLHELMFKYAHSGRINELTSNTAEYIYMNYPDGYVTVRSKVMDMPVEFVEEKEQPQWRLTDEVKVIEGYECHGAEADFRGRRWIAWYTEDIPMNAGPWKLWGLPGLILEAYDTEDHYKYTVTSISSKSSGNVVLFDWKKKYKKMSRADYLKSMYNTDFLMNEETQSKGIADFAKLQGDRKYDFREKDYR